MVKMLYGIGRMLFVVHFEGIDDRSAAEALKGRELMVSADDRPPLAEGEFHLLDLVGLEVRLGADQPCIGTVSDLISAGNDLLELRNLVDVADVIIRSALMRKESRGLHYSRDYPQALPRAFDTVLMSKYISELGSL